VQLNWNVGRLMRRYGWTATQVQQQVVDRYNGPLKGGGFDPDSIMMYEYEPGDATYPDGRPFVTPRNTALSATDKVVTNMLYPRPGVTPLPEGVLVVGDDRPTDGALSIDEPGQVATYRFRPTAGASYSVETTGSTPLLVSVSKNPTDPGGRLWAVEGPDEPLQFRAPDGDPRFVQVRHGSPLTGTGAFGITIREL
jgi:hypothetical protein